MIRRLAAMLAVCLGLVSPGAAAQSVFLGQFSALWSEPDNWTPVGIPSAGHARFVMPGPGSTAVVDFTGYTLNRLDLYGTNPLSITGLPLTMVGANARIESNGIPKSVGAPLVFQQGVTVLPSQDLTLASVSGDANLTVDGAGTLTVTNLGLSSLATVELAPGATLVAAPTLAPNLHLGATATMGSSGGGTWGTVTGTGFLALEGEVRFGQGDGSSTFDGIVAGPGTLRKVGSGTIVLAGNADHQGGTTVDSGELRFQSSFPDGPVHLDGGRLVIAIPAGAFFGSLTGHGTLEIASGGVVQTGPWTFGVGDVLLDGMLSLPLGGTIGTLAGSGSLSLGASTTVGHLFAYTTFSGPITGPGPLSFRYGELTLTNAVSTPIALRDSATLVLSSTAVLTEPVSAGVPSGAGYLHGSGVITAPVTIAGGGLMPQPLLTVGDLSLNADLQIIIEDLSHGKLVVTGTTTLGPNATLALARTFGAVLDPGESFVLLESSGPITGTFAGLPEGALFLGAGVPMRISYQGQKVTVTVSAHTVTPSAGPGGTIDPATPQLVLEGSTPAFTVTPAANHSMSVGGCGGTLTGNTYTTAPVTADCTVLASFPPITHTVTPSSNTGGTVTPSTPQTVNQGTTTSFTISPQPGYVAVIGGNCPAGSMAGNVYTTGIITGPCTVTVTFSITQRTVTASAGANGTIAPSGALQVDYGTTPSFTVTPDAGYSASVGGTCGGSLAGNTFTASAVTGDCTVTATFTLVNPPRLGNISTRMQVLTGNDVMIGGFVIGGSTNKTVAIVATGPSLAAFGITNALANPTLRLVRSSDQATLATNDDWQTAANSAQLTAAGFAPTNALEAAILVSLAPGAYTAIVEGAGGGTGVAVVGVYEVDGPTIPLANISTRGRVLTGNDVMIGGFVVQGSGPQTLAIVATGPSLAAFGITSPLANPTIRLVRSSDQVVIASNDDWQADVNASQLQAAGFAPTNALESGLYVTLPPGAYTVIVEGVGGATGVAVIGVYAVN